MQNSILNLAEIYCRKGKPNEAIFLCQKVVNDGTGYPDVYSVLGHALEICGRLEEAISAYRQALLYTPQDTKLLLEIGKIYQANNQPDKSIEVYRKVIEQDPNTTHAYWMLGNLLKQQGREAEAIIYHTKLLVLDWNAPIIDYDYEALVHQGHVQAAIDYALQILRRNPNELSSVSLIVFLINHLIQINQLQDATKLSMCVLTHAPSLHLGYASLSKIFEQMGYLDWARSCHMLNVPLEVLGDSSTISKIKLRHDEHPKIQYIDVYPEKNIYVSPSAALNKTLHIGLQGSYHTTPAAYVAIVREGRVWADAGQTSAVFTPDGYLLEDLSSGSSSLIASSSDLSQPRKIHGRVVFLSIKYSGNYCHWTADVISRISLLKRSNIDLNTVDYFIVSSRAFPFQRDMLELLSIPKEKIIESSEEHHICASEIIIPSLPGHHPILPPWSIQVLREDWLPMVADRLAGLPKKVYLSREGVSYRKVLNEDCLIDLLTKHGFSCINPSRLHVLDQIAALAAAQIVISPHGAALTNAIFMAPRSSVIEIFPQDYMNPCYHIALSQIPIKHFSFWGDLPDSGSASQNSLEIRDLDNLYINLSELEQVITRFA